MFEELVSMANANMQRMIDRMPVDGSMKHLSKQEVVFQSTSLYGDNDLPSGRLVDSIAFLQEILAKIPEEYRAEAVFEIEGESDGYGANWAEARVYYMRAETDAERDDRLKKAVRQATERAADERAEYERLKARYGP